MDRISGGAHPVLEWHFISTHTESARQTPSPPSPAEMQVESFRKIHGNGIATTMCIG